MGKTKDFSSNALATLTGKPKLPGTQVENKVQTVKQVQEEPAVKQAVVDIPAEAAEKALAKTSAPKSVPQVKKEGSAKGKKKVVKAKSTSGEGPMDPNKRSTRAKNTQIAFYLNEQNVNMLKKIAEDEDQKVSWIVDEIIYEYLAGRK